MPPESARQRRGGPRAGCGQTGRRGLRRPGQAAKDHPEILDRYLLTQAVTPGDDFFAALARGVLDRRVAALCAQGREARGAAVQPGRPGPAGGVDLNHTLVVLEEGAEATLVRETAGRGAERGPALHAGASRSSWRRAPGSGWSTSRTGTTPPGTSAGSGPSSAATPRSSGPSAAWARGSPRSTRRSSWPGRGPMPRSTA